ncbi:MAG: Na/Pi cotransporter family protein [Magnetococcales bacterium]|nr:Na/Pi cotransporter family protein [Magnetococcales bacterium]
MNSRTLPIPRSVLLVMAGVWLLLPATGDALASSMDLASAKQALTASGSEINFVKMAIELLGGLALFLYGMEQMTASLKAIAGNRMKSILGTLTTNRVTGVFTGAFLTAIIQSSSVTTVLVVGFVSAGLLSLSQSIGIIFGAEIGTTITAQIIAFKVTKYSLVMITVGFLMMFLANTEQVRGVGKVVLGLGLVFFGMTVMSTAMKPLRTYAPFMELMINIENPLVGILITAGFTALVQSSSATTAIVIVMASQGFISLQAGIALAFGANIGTCVTALLASIGKPREAVRAALVHITFNTTGVLLWVSFIPYIAEVVTMISPVAEGVTGMEKLAAETPRQIANAHTLFNITNTLMFLPFVHQFARFVTWVIPDPDATVTSEKRGAVPHLNPGIMNTPSLAMPLVRREIHHRLGQPVREMFREIVPAILNRDAAGLQAIRQRDEEVNLNYKRVLGQLVKIGGHHTNRSQTGEFHALMSITNDLEDLGDAIKVNFVHLGEQCVRQNLHFDSDTTGMIEAFHLETLAALEDALCVVADQNKADMARLQARLPRIQEFSGRALAKTTQSLIEHPEEMEIYHMQMELHDKFRWVFYRANRMATAAMDHPMPDEGQEQTPVGPIFPKKVVSAGHGMQ